MSAEPTFTLTLQPPSSTVSDMWRWSVSASAPPPGTMMMWGISGIWKKRDNGDWQSAPNIFTDPAGSKGGTWLTYGDGDQNFPIDVKCSITYTLFGPGGSSQGSAETNTVTATPGNMVTHCTGGNALLILHSPGDEDPNTPGAEEHVLTWNAYHQDWCHSAFANEHMHCGISVLPVTGNPASPDWQVTVPQADPGDGSYTWEGQRTPPRPSAPKGIYTWLVSASHKYDPDGTGCPVGCSHVAQCPPDTDKVGQLATVESFEYLHLDPEANRLFVRVTYALATDVGECTVKVFTPSFDAVAWTASGDELTAGTHTTDVLEIEGVDDEQGNVVDGDEFCAVVLSSQTAAEGLLNRDRQPKPHVPHGMYGQAQTGSVTLESISFEEDIPMKYAVHPLDGNPVDLGNPEWTRADVRQDWKLLRPYCTCPRPYDFLPGSPSGACPNHGGAWSGPKRDPAAYVRPSKANRTNNIPLLVALKGPAGATGTAWATGSLGGVVAFPVEFDSNGDATDQPAHTGAEVTDMVDVLDVNWSWHFQFDETAHQIPLGDSEHTVYVTLDASILSPNLVYWQLIDFSCRWAEGGEAAAYVFDEIWYEFRFNYEPPYQYYTENFWVFEPTNDEASERTPDYRLRSLLGAERGRCGDYALLMLGLNAVHGIRVEIQGVEGGPQGDGSGTWVWFHVRNRGAPGIRAHATLDPVAKYFFDHALCYYQDRLALYDPSYGICKTGASADEALLNYENYSICDYSASSSQPPPPLPPGDLYFGWVPNDLNAPTAELAYMQGGG